MRSAFRRAAALALVLPLIVLCAQRAEAVPLTVTVGSFSFDNLIPAAPDSGPGVNAFDIFNLTDLGTDLDGSGVILPGLTFQGLQVQLTDDGGNTTTPLDPLTTLAPNGPLVDSTGVSPLLYSDTQLFTLAVVTGTISAFSVTLADGSVFNALDSLFSATLQAPLGSSLTAGVDSINITITGDLVAPTSTVPEPGTLALLATGLAVTLRRRTSARS